MNTDQAIEILENHLYSGKMPSKEHFKALALAVAALKALRRAGNKANVRALSNCIEGMASDADDNGRERFLVNLETKDAFTIAWALNAVSQFMPGPPEEGDCKK